MENKLNYQAIEQYSNQFTEKVADAWYSEHKELRGKDILSITSLKQVNLFTIKNLFFSWKDEAARLESPYFDYSADEVQVALTNFMNALSQNILVAKDDFIPLLSASVQDTLLLVISPYTYFKREVNSPSSGSISLEYLKDLRKYVKVNFDILDAVINEFEKRQINSASREDAHTLFEDVFNGLEGEPAELSAFVEDFSKTVPLSLQALYQSDGPIVDSPIGEHEEISLNENSDSERMTLNDTFEEVDKSTLVQELQFAKISNLKESLSVNQKFMFINKLFAGDSAMFHEALNRIETLGSKDDALAILSSDFPVSQSWEEEADEVIEFMELLDRRFK
jgi:hypothetical protein